jgi:predicted enzyme related to lactoylglutathione lyase
MEVLAAFSGVSVDKLADAEKFYAQVLGLKVENNGMGLQISLPHGGQMFVYEKADHEPASFTVLNFVVADIDKTVAELKDKGVKFEVYPNMHQDDSGVARGRAANIGPDIAWFKDPAGNILSVLETGEAK